MRTALSCALSGLLLLIAALAMPAAAGTAMISTANGHASQAGRDMLVKGGSAMDAAIAAQLVLTLTEPQSSGIGGGLFALNWDADKGKTTAWDGRETAPMAADEGLFLAADGEPMSWVDASVGGRPVGVPGVVAVLWAAHRAHGKLSWAELFEPAISLSENGFVVSPRMHEAIAASPRLSEDDQARALYFLDSGAPIPAGHVLKNPALAHTLRRIAKQGPTGFYTGPIAAQIVAKVTSHVSNPGGMTLSDLANYQAKQREPVCSTYRAYTVCGMPPPTSGGLTSLMILGMLEPYRMGLLRPNSPVAMHLFTQASRYAYADRGAYMADADFVAVPVKGLLDKAYLRNRAKLIHPGHDRGTVPPGLPNGADAELQKAASSGIIEYGTSHLAVVDHDGNAVSMTTSVEQRFGAHMMAGGFVLNNQLTDFSFRPERGGVKVANRVQPGKRPRSSMSPSLVIGPDGQLFAVIGSPGGSRIILYTTHSILGLIDWGLTMQEAINLAHVINRNGVTEVEAGRAPDRLAASLQAMGHKVKRTKLTSGLHGIRIVNGKLDGGADPRREGVVITIRE